MMEKLNINLTGKENKEKTIFWILSLLSWLFYLIMGWLSLSWLKGKLFITFQIIRIIYFPIQLQETFYYIILILTMIISTLAFILYIYNSTIKKDLSFFSNMFDKYTKWHFLIFLFQGFLFLIPKLTNLIDNWENLYLFGIIIDIITLSILLFIYIKTNFGNNKIHCGIIKKGVYSSLLSLDFYYLCYSFCQFKLQNLLFPGDLKKQLGITFDILMGIVMLIATYFFKNVIIAFYSILIYLGIFVFYFSLNEVFRETIADPIISIIFILLFASLSSYLILKNKWDLLQ